MKPNNRKPDDSESSPDSTTDADLLSPSSLEEHVARPSSVPANESSAGYGSVTSSQNGGSYEDEERIHQAINNADADRNGDLENPDVNLDDSLTQRSPDSQGSLPDSQGSVSSQESYFDSQDSQRSGYSEVSVSLGSIGSGSVSITDEVPSISQSPPRRQTRIGAGGPSSHVAGIAGQSQMLNDYLSGTQISFFASQGSQEPSQSDENES